MTTSARFWDKIAEKYSKQAIANEAAYQKKLQVTREHFRPDMEVLELGCGTGSAAIAHAPYVKHLRAIDISSKMLAIARAKAADAGVDNVTFEQAIIEELEGDGPAFDAVLGLSILHLLEDEAAAIAKVYRLLKPGGIFVSSTACLGDGMAWMKAIAPIGTWLGAMPLIKVFTATHLREQLNAAGFAIDCEWRPSKKEAVFIVAKKPR